MNRARRQQYMLRTEASEQEAMPIENNKVIKTMAEME